MTRFVIDSWAWVEYLRGSEAGQKVRKAVEREEEFITHVVTIAEIASKFARERMDVDGAWRAITTLSKIEGLDETDAKDAGLLHASVKEKRSNFSLADAFVLHTARKMNAKVLTGDPDFRGMDEALMLK